MATDTMTITNPSLTNLPLSPASLEHKVLRPLAAKVPSNDDKLTLGIDRISRSPSGRENDSASSPRGDLEPLAVEQPNFVEAKESWRKPKGNMFRLAYVFLAFFNIGMEGGAFGPLIPSLESYYGLSYTSVSLIFLSTFPGYVLAATTSDRLHQFAGQRGIAIFGSTLRTITYIGVSQHPPWAVVIVLLVLDGWGGGLLDAGWNTWVAELDRPNELLGLIHGFYGMGAAVAPLVASAMINQFGLQWYRFFYVLVCLAGLELVAGAAAFWHHTGLAFRRRHTDDTHQTGRTRAALREKVTWLVAVFLFFYTGVEVALSGWVVTFMMRVRAGKPFQSAMVSTGFWLGITMGRLTLGFVTGKLGERWSIAAYLVLAMALELLFWMVPRFVISAVAVSLVGYFLGPMFPAAIVVASKLLPMNLHVGAISFAAAVGTGGAAVLPFGVGAIASAKGVQVLQPIILAVIILLLLLWLTLPKIPRHPHSD